jgi:hypothetical protein
MHTRSFRSSRFPFAFFLTVWVAAVHAAPLWAASCIYGNSSNDLMIRFNPGTLEVGDEILLAGTERYLTYFDFEFWGTNASHPASFSGPVEARVRFYQNNGAPYNGYASPGTSFYDSGWFSVGSPTARSTLIFTAGSDFPSGGLFIPVDGTTWSVQFQGMAAEDFVGVDLYSPPVIGMSYPDYWENNGGWRLQTNVVPMDFGARMYAIAGQTVNLDPPWLTHVVSGSNLMLSWAADHIGWKLQIQTNAPHLGITTSWYTVNNSSTTNLWTLPIDQARASVFCRLIYP